MSTLLNGLTDTDLIRRVTLTGSSSYQFTAAQGMDLTQYQAFEFELMNIVPTTDTADFWLRVNGDSGANTYRYASRYVDENTGTGVLCSETGSKIVLIVDIGNADPAEQGAFGKVRLLHPGSSTIFPRFEYYISTINSATRCYENRGSGRRMASAQITSVDFLPSTGTFASGIIDIYGRRLPVS